jgi:ParB family chromosome partitioning protein
MSQLYSNSIFWIDIEKVKPNPFQPRREFDEARLRDLADSIRQYGVLQPLVVSRIEIVKEDEGIVVEYELIAGERRLRASKLAGLLQVPVIIRVGDDNMAKLELAIIENLQREDLNAVERARAFFRLVEEFKFTHTQIGVKVGKSREYVSNTLRLLALPQEMLDALSAGKISEGHTRPILMLSDRPEEQSVLFKEIMWKKLTVRDAEKIARKIAFDKVRKREYIQDPEISEIEGKLQETLGTRVHIEKKENGGYITIDFFTNDDLRTILDIIKSKNEGGNPNLMLEKFISQKESEAKVEIIPTLIDSNLPPDSINNDLPVSEGELVSAEDDIHLMDDRTNDEIKKSEEDVDLYNISNFSV